MVPQPSSLGLPCLPLVRAAITLCLQLVLLSCVATALRAHDCGPPTLSVLEGEVCTWTITADRTESSSTYTPTLTGPLGVAFVTPVRQFSAKHGVFTINGNTVGTNRLTVEWSYPATGAAGSCTVDIVVLPASTNINAQSVVREGALSSHNGSNVIRARVLSDAISHHIPAVAQKLLIFTQCYGGSMAFARFRSAPNTVVLSASSPGQEAKYGGYDDDAASALRPAVGRTALDVHEAGVVGKKTLPPRHGSPPPSKSADFQASEWPRVAGELAVTDFSLASASGSGPVRSRHIVIYAGDPGTAAIRSSVHDGRTIPDAHGDRTNQVSDTGVRDTIKQNFRDEPFTTVHTVGGAPAEGNPQAGKNGWDFPGSFEGLQQALRAAGAAISNSPNPAAEQFIFFVTDHGSQGWGAPYATAPVLGARASTAAIRGLHIFDPGSRPTEQAMLNDPGNQSGLFLDLILSPPPNSPAPSRFATSSARLALELHGTNGSVLRLTNSFLTVLDIDGDGQAGSVAGESEQFFFPLDESVLARLLQGTEVDVVVDNMGDQTYELLAFGLTSGAIRKTSTLVPPPFIASSRRLAGSSLELEVEGIAHFDYALETSGNLVTWQRGAPIRFTADRMTLTNAVDAARPFLRVVWLDQ